MQIDVGTLVEFKRHTVTLGNIQTSFKPTNILVITGHETDEVYECCLADYRGEPISSTCDTVFREEFEPLPLRNVNVATGCSSSEG